VDKFLRFKDKMAVLERAKYLRGTKIFINEEFSEAVRQSWKELIPAMKAAYIRYDKLIANLPPKSLGGVREPSFRVSSFSPTSHTHTHTRIHTHQLTLTSA
jgi:hypothetical protein